MSDKEYAIQLIDRLPNYKLGYVIAYLQGLSADETADDEYCRSLISDYENSTDKGDFVSLDEAMKICGVTDDGIQN